MRGPIIDTYINNIAANSKLNKSKASKIYIANIFVLASVLLIAIAVVLTIFSASAPNTIKNADTSRNSSENTNNISNMSNSVEVNFLPNAT